MTDACIRTDPSGSTALYFGLCLSVVPHFSAIVSSSSPSEQAADLQNFWRLSNMDAHACLHRRAISLELERQGKEGLGTDWQGPVSFTTFDVIKRRSHN